MISSRIAAGIAGASLLLSSTPAFAIGLGLGGSHAASVHLMNASARTESNASVHGSVKANMHARSDMNSTSTGAKVHTDSRFGVSTEHQIRNVRTMLQRVIHRIAQTYQRICDRDNTNNAGAVKACMDKAKADVKASVSAMIDVSFGS